MALQLFIILSKKNLKANHNTDLATIDEGLLFIILSKKNLKANHNEGVLVPLTARVVYNIVKEKSESKSQQHGCMCLRALRLFIILSKKNLKANHNKTIIKFLTTQVVYNIVKEKSESKSQRCNDNIVHAYGCL